MRYINRRKGMYLIKKDINDLNTEIEVTFEKVVEDLLMVTVKNNLDSENILSYWRLTQVQGIPPLELGIDCEKELVSSVVFYIDTTYFKVIDIKDFKMSLGNVVLDSNIFNKRNDYIDIDDGYSVAISDDRLICQFNFSKSFNEAYKNGRFEIYLNEDQQVCGFSISNLLEDEINQIKSIKKNN
jgi:hypothetical protein